MAMIVYGFIEPFTKELPMEYAVELNRPIQLQMEGSVGWQPSAGPTPWRCRTRGWQSCIDPTRVYGSN
jgi:hypothetical protein